MSRNFHQYAGYHRRGPLVAFEVFFSRGKYWWWPADPHDPWPNEIAYGPFPNAKAAYLDAIDPSPLTSAQRGRWQ